MQIADGVGEDPLLGVEEFGLGERGAPPLVEYGADGDRTKNYTVRSGEV